LLLRAAIGVVRGPAPADLHFANRALLMIVKLCCAAPRHETQQNICPTSPPPHPRGHPEFLCVKLLFREGPITINVSHKTAKSELKMRIEAENAFHEKEKVTMVSTTMKTVTWRGAVPRCGARGRGRSAHHLRVRSASKEAAPSSQAASTLPMMPSDRYVAMNRFRVQDRAEADAKFEKVRSHIKVPGSTLV